MKKTTDEVFYVRLAHDTAATRSGLSGAWETLRETEDRRIGAVAARIEKSRGTGGVSVFLETVRSVFVPEPLFDPAAVEGYLAANGWELRDGEEVVISTAAAGIVALMAWRADETAAIRHASPDTARFWSPIQLLAANPQDESVSVRIAGNIAYLAVFERSLQYVEILPCFSPDDLIFYLHKLEERFPVRKMTVRLSGDDPAELRKALRRYYKRVETRDDADLIAGFAARTEPENTK